MKNLLKPTPRQIQYRNRKWAEALLTSEKATGRLTVGNGRCCLGVACDVAHKLSKGKLDEAESQGRIYMPHEDIASFFGWNSGDSSGSCILNFNGEEQHAAFLNDGYHNHGKTIVPLEHKQISELVINTYVRPKSSKK
jgi:hypothetical protein